jgi:hypothetical protein
MTATAGQLYNFLVFCASLVLFLSNVLDFRFKVILFKSFEDNIQLLGTILLMGTSMGATFFSIISPYEMEAEEGPKFVGESLITILYTTFLFHTSTTVPTDDPSLLYRTTFESIITAVNGTLVSENVNIYALEGSEDVLLRDVGLWFIKLVHWSKLFCFLAACLYSFRVVWANKPDCGRETRFNFFEHLLARLTLLALTIAAAYYWVVNVVQVKDTTIRSTISNAQDLLDDYGVGGLDRWLVDPTVRLAFSFASTLALLGVAGYVAIFYENYGYGMVCVLLVSVQNMVQADGNLSDGPSFGAMVVTAWIGGLFFAGTGINWMIRQYRAGVVLGKVVPDFLFKVGSILSVLALLFLVVAFSYSWMDFVFKPTSLALDVSQLLDDADARIDGMVDDIVDVARALDPCVRKRIVPTTDIEVASTPADVDAQMREVRKDIRDDPASADSQCIINNANYDIDTSFSPRCVDLKTRLDDQRDELVTSINSASSLNKPYEGNEDNEYFVDDNCRNIQCGVLLSAGIAAMALSAVPFCGPIGFAAGTAARAGNTIYKIGRKVAKYAPRIRRKRNKIRKMANRIRSLVTITKGKIHFNLKLAMVFIPVVTGATVTLCLLMFRRDIYRKPGDEYKQLTNRLTRGLSLAIGIYAPLALVNLVFYVTLELLPELFNAVFNELPLVLVNVEMQTEVGYTSLKLAYLLSFVGNALVVSSNVMFLFDNSVIAAVMYFVRRAQNAAIRIRKAWREQRQRSREAWKRENASVQTGANAGVRKFARVGRKVSLYTWQAAKRLGFALANWKSIYFQPLFFSIPALWIVWGALITDKPYFKFAYKANSDLGQANDEIVEVIALEDRSEAVNQEMDNGLCGLVGQLAEALLNAIPGGLLRVANVVSSFTATLAGAFGAARDFLDAISDLVEFPSISIVLPGIPGIPAALANFGIFAIPFICSMLLLFVWIVALFVEDVEALFGFGDSKVSGNEKQVATSITVFVLYASLTNILLHTVIGNLVQSLQNYEMPFISMDIGLGEDYYLTQLCSLLNLMSAIALYLNIMLPPT